MTETDEQPATQGSGEATPELPGLHRDDDDGTSRSWSPNRAQRRGMGYYEPVGSSVGPQLPRSVRRNGMKGLAGDMRQRRNRRHRAKLGRALAPFGIEPVLRESNAE